MNTIEKLEARREWLLKEAETIATVISYLKREGLGESHKKHQTYRNDLGEVMKVSLVENMLFPKDEKPAKRPRQAWYTRKELSIIKKRFYELLAEGKREREADEIIGDELNRTHKGISQCRHRHGWLAKKVKK